MFFFFLIERVECAAVVSRFAGQLSLTYPIVDKRWGRDKVPHTPHVTGRQPPASTPGPQTAHCRPPKVDKPDLAG